MSITGYIPTLEAQFTFHDSNSPAATQWGYQFVAYLQKNGTTSKTRYPQGRIDASALTDGSTQTVRFPGVTPGTSYDGFVALADGQGNETPQVPLFTNYAVPKVASGSPVGPIWGKLHHLPIETDPTHGTWNTGTGAFDPSVHDPVVLLSSVTGNQRNLIPDSGFKLWNGYWASSASYWGYNNFWDAATYSRTGTGGSYERLQSTGMVVVQNSNYSLSVYIDATSVVSGAVTCNIRSSVGGSILKNFGVTPGTAGKVYTAPNFSVGANSTVYFDVECDSVTMSNSSAVLIVRTPQLEMGSSCTAYRPNEMDSVTGSLAYGGHHPVFKGLVNSDGSAGKTTDWLPEGTNKYAAEHGADITGNHTANDTSHVNGVAASSISPIATIMPAEANADVTANHNSAGTGSGGNARSAANLAAIVGTDNAIPSSTPWKAHILNSLANLISNITVHTYSASSGALSMWFTSTSNSSSPGGSTYPAWTYPDGSGAIYPGHTNGYSYVNGTSQSAAAENNSFQWTGLGSGGVYIGVKYDIASDAFSIVYGPSSTAPTDAQIASVAGDGSICTVIASATTNSIIATSGGGGSSFTGGGGRQRQ